MANEKGKEEKREFGKTKKKRPERDESRKKKQLRTEPKRAKTGLLSVGDIGKIAGVPSNTVQHWKYRDPGFPKPVDSPTSGDLYRRGEVVAWLRRTGRMK